MSEKTRLSPLEKNPVKVIQRSPDVLPGNGYTLGESEVGESRRVQWLRLLWNERRFLRRVTLYGVALALIVAFILPVRFESRARLMPPDQQSGTGLAMLAALAGHSSSGSSSSGGIGSALGGGLGGVAGDLLGIKSSGALFVDMLEGPTVQDQIIGKFDLRKLYGLKYWEDARRELAARTTIKEDRKSGVITIAVADRDPRRAQQMAQAYVDALNGLVAKVSTSSARRERMFLEDRLKAVKQRLDSASQEFSEFASKSGTLNVPDQTKAMVDSEATLQGQLVAAESELEGVRQIYTDSNVRVKTLQARVASLKHEVEQMSGAGADLASAQGDIPGGFPSIRKLPLVGVRWANLYRENKVQETVYELLTQEYEMAKIQEAKEIPSVNTLDAPMVPERKSFPPRTLIVLVGAFLAFTMGSAFVIGAAVWQRSDSAEKQLASEIWRDVSSRPSPTRAAMQRFWAKIGGRNGSNRKAA
ncbi:MAG TPA: GNVR domain-containing protein [Terriglobales bacterium]|nr:GNVR domain-containing protein [Terriglobales bacterium]